MRLLLCMAALLAPALPSAAQDAGGAAFRATTLDLSATGEVRARPDLARVSAGVQDEGATASEAVLQNRRQMGAALAALRAQGVSEGDIQTETLSLQPQYVYEAGKPRRLTGYQASNIVVARLHDLAHVGQVVDALVAAGADEIDSISFEIDDRTPAENAAREAALKALAAKAALYAQATGYHIARLVRLSEEGSSQPLPPRPIFAAARALSAPPTEVAPGELSVSSTVSAEYELAR